MQTTKVGVTVRISRNYDRQVVTYEQMEEASLDQGDDRDKVVEEMRDRAFKEVTAASNKALDMLVAAQNKP